VKKHAAALLHLHGTGSLFLNGKKGRNERCWTPVSGTFNVHYSTLYATLVGVHYIPSRRRANVGKRRCTHLLHLQEPVKHRPVLARGYPRQSDFRLFFGHLENVTLSRAAQSDLSATVSSQKGEEESTAWSCPTVLFCTHACRSIAAGRVAVAPYLMHFVFVFNTLLNLRTCTHVFAFELQLLEY
jgi:hypothetical protein